MTFHEHNISSVGSVSAAKEREAVNETGPSEEGFLLPHDGPPVRAHTGRVRPQPAASSSPSASLTGVRASSQRPSDFLNGGDGRFAAPLAVGGPDYD